MFTNQINSASRSDIRQFLLSLLLEGIGSVKGDNVLRSKNKFQDFERTTRVISIGKAASAMVLGLPESIRNRVPILIVTKHGHSESTLNSSNIDYMETSHPVPCDQSFIAGKRIQSWVKSCEPNDHLLFLISGGASSLAEVLIPGFRQSDLIEVTQKALANGSPIGKINDERILYSQIKGGKLLTNFRGATVEVLAISDVPGDDINIIGSGIGACSEPKFDYTCNIVASNKVARDIILKSAKINHNMAVHENTETLYGDVHDIAAKLAKELISGPKGIYIFGGEPTVQLPENPGQGGRNQGLALILANLLEGNPSISMVVAGTDGSDGVSQAAGAFVDGESFRLADGGEDAIFRADSGSFFERSGDQIVTGPTGTNVMDLVIALKR